MSLKETIQRMKMPASIWEDKLRLLVIEIETLKDQLKRDLKDAVKNATSEALFQDFAKIQAFKDEVKNSVDLILESIEKKKEQTIAHTDENIYKSISDFQSKFEVLLSDAKEKINLLSTEHSQQFKNTIAKIETLRGPAGETPVKNVDYFDGKNADPQDVVPFVLKEIKQEEPNALVEKINNADKKVKLNSIEGLQEEIISLKKTIREKGGGSGGGGMGKVIHNQFSGNGVLTSFTLTDKVAGGGQAVFACRYQGQVQYYGDQFTISNKTLSFTFTPENGSTIEITYMR